MRQQDGVHIDISGKSKADLYNIAGTFFLEACGGTEMHYTDKW